LSESDGYAPCPLDRQASGLLPTAVCESPSRARRESHRSAGGGGPRRGGASEAPKAAEGSSDLGDLLSAADDRVLTRTIRGLERISGADPHAARHWSDLAAAYLVRSQRADDPRDLLRAYGAADRAVQEDGALPAARFNRALALERLFLVPEAIAAWRDYLYLDGISGWAMEAQSHLRTLDRPSPRSEWEQQRKQLEPAAAAGDPEKVEAIVHQYRQAAREYAEQELFGLWADAVVAGRQELAADRLRLLHRLGDALVKIEGEHLVQDSVAAIDAVSATGDPVRWRDLVQAHKTFRDGYHAYRARNCKEAAVKLSAAREGLANAGSPLAIQAELFLACCDYLTDRYSQGLTAAKQLARRVQGSAYGGLRAYVFRVQAVLEEGLGQTRAAAEDYGKAMAEFRALGEGENVANAGGMVGQALSFLGREQQAWRYVYQALRTLPELRDATARVNVLMIAGDTALRDGADAAALAFDRARVRESFRAGPLAAVEALLWLARIQEHREDRRSARATLEEARARVDRLEDPRTRRRRQADLAMIEGEMRTQDDPRQAVSLLTSALAVYQRDENFLFSLRTLLARGRAQRQKGDVREAERDLGAALALYDRLGEQLKQEDFRLPFLEETDAVFDEMVSLQAGRDPDLAFAYADRARTRVLPGTASALWTGGSAATGDHLPVEPQPLPLDEIRRRLPAGITLAQYSVLPDRVLIWVLRHDEDNPRFFVQHGSRAELNLKAARLQEFATGTWEPAAEDLFDRLVRPWLAAVPAGERIVFVPDKVLHRIPFATLRDRATKRLLVEDHPVAIAPSATLYVRALERQAGERKSSRSAGLVIGDPAVDHFLFPDLSSLRESADEARRVAAMTGSRLVTGSTATRSVFLAEASQADWIHFSGHALVDPRNPLLSMLVLTPESKGDPGVLTAQEIYSLKLGRTRLIVLAACDTGNEYIPGGEGATSLARAFLAAGVPTVVASLWSVDDRATSVLFDAFHRSLWTSGDPVDALRQAQLGMLHGRNEGDRSPRAWAAFEVIGASNE
jgi:CHAT domain-containing protein